MFCKYKTNIAKRKKTISKHPFFYHEAIPLPYLSPLSFPISSIISIPLYHIYTPLSHLSLLPQKAGGGIRLSELKLILYANNMSVRLVIVIVVMYRLIEIVQPHFMFLSNLPVYACRIACLLH